MSAMSDYLELKFLDHFTGTASNSAPSAVYLGLATASIQDDASGSELSGNNYTRKAVTFASAASGSISSNAAVEFNAATGSWGMLLTLIITIKRLWTLVYKLMDINA